MWEILGIGFGLSMDAFAVSVTNGITYPALSAKKKWAIPVFFGAFQGIMPCAGYFSGQLVAGFVEAWAGPVALVILGLIGAKMIRDGLRSDVQPSEEKDGLTWRLLYLQALATSIDAFAVGFSFSVSRAPLFPAAPVIAVTTFFCSAVAFLVGRRLGGHIGGKAQVLGGVILVLIGIGAAR